MRRHHWNKGVWWCGGGNNKNVLCIISNKRGTLKMKTDDNVNSILFPERFEDNKGVIRNHTSKTDCQCIGQKKTDRQWSTKHYRENESLSNTNSSKNRECSGKANSCIRCVTLVIKTVMSLMRKEPDCDYDKADHYFLIWSPDSFVYCVTFKRSLISAALLSEWRSQ